MYIQFNKIYQKIKFAFRFLIFGNLKRIFQTHFQLLNYLLFIFHYKLFFTTQLLSLLIYQITKEQIQNQQLAEQDEINNLINDQFEEGEEFEDYEEGEELEELEESDLQQLPPYDAVIYKMIQIQKKEVEPNEILTVQQQIDELKINQIKKFYPVIMQLTSDRIVVVLYAFSKHFYAFSFKQHRQLYQLFEHLLQIQLSEQDETFLSAVLIQFLQTKFQGYKITQEENNYNFNILMYKKFVKTLITNNQINDQNCRILQTVFKNLPDFMKKSIIQQLIKQLSFFVSMNQKGKAVGLFTTKTKSQKQAKQNTVDNKLLSLQTFNYCKICWILVNDMQEYIFPLTDVSLEIMMMLELKPSSYCFILQLCKVISQNTIYYTPLYQFFLRILDFVLQQLPTTSLQINLKIYSNKLFESDGQQVKKNLVIVPAQFPDTLLYKTYLFQMWKETLIIYLQKLLEIKQQVFPEATNAFLYQITQIINNFYPNKMHYKEFQRGSMKVINNELKDIKKMITEQQNQIKYQRGKSGKYQPVTDEALVINLFIKEQQQKESQEHTVKISNKQLPQKIETNTGDKDIIKPLIL